MINWIKFLAISIVAVFAPIQAVLATVVVLVLADMVTGVIAAYKDKEPITSAKLRTTVSKLIIYLAAICLGYLVEAYLLVDLLPVSKLIAGTVGMVEFKSLLENLNKINGSDLFKQLVSQLGSSNLVQNEMPTPPAVTPEDKNGKN